jgi:hypothetical protein
MIRGSHETAMRRNSRRAVVRTVPRPDRLAARLERMLSR